ncbi:MAG: acyl-CoA thioesterase [Muribaculaceae bacterium]|jgi:acyl-CoA thioester hydrolase|uniref:acyl-CoA thioesterase n=1 Tax=Bacteroidales TaxID=171549 RepID=UPI000E9EB4DD|nr:MULTISPECIES: acyl-CoA thioesterase [Bacteroidales]MBJ2191735.1 acyl-CoA thioesterase [Muribaculaceae bacterium]ROS85052.1 acyl-CoA thioesterase [Muribaculaceae bacterium Isolate-036 (Harlan)]ROT21347.1 acyl-CoA thioesterase [Muribaculaceae bacterium Isolate-113 (HZI)]ROT24108.1 acyl-CoA thioesterase [Muribaculaceae bacterium Isolate-114 (HZI)]RXE68421.1 acyl-CoA thioesterase [Muribaculaceae bacterium Isolate-001 (NCI)]HBY16406.1 thioesterase [Porphyromonadaceae bacterium]
MRILKEKNKKYCFIMDMEVRDYELDCEQIVNNANYLHYMEHTRHRFCMDAGVSFTQMHNNGIDAVVRKIEIEYKTSLRGGDTFLSCLRVERKGARFIFHQDIIRSDGEVCTEAVVTCVILKDGKLTRGDELARLFAKYL